MAKGQRNLLGEWLQRELDTKKMTVNEYASKSGVAHTILFRILSGSATPTLGTLAKLARYSKSDIGVLARLCFPDATFDTMPDAQMMINDYSHLPSIYREMIASMIRGLLADQERGKNG